MSLLSLGGRSPIDRPAQLEPASVALQMIPARSMSREQQLLLLCARSYHGSDDLSRIRELVLSGIEWDTFLVATASQGVTPLVHSTLVRLGEAAISKSIRDELARRYRAIATRNLFLAARTCEVVTLLENAGIRSLAYKGAPLAIQAYGSLTLREFGDVDILVDHSDYPAACCFFRELGCSEVDWGWESTYQAPQMGVTIDLHRELFPERFPVKLLFRDAWERTEIIPILSRNARTMSREDMLVVLAVQLMKDVWSSSGVRLSKLCDIAELIRSSRELDWGRITSASRGPGVSRMLAVSFDLIRELLGVENDLPEFPEQRSRAYFRVVDFVRSRLTRGDTEFRYLGVSGNKWFHFWLRERWRDRLQPISSEILLKMRPNVRDYSLVSLPAPLRHFYFVVRPFRLFRDHVLHAKRDKD